MNLPTLVSHPPSLGMPLHSCAMYPPPKIHLQVYKIELDENHFEITFRKSNTFASI